MLAVDQNTTHSRPPLHAPGKYLLLFIVLGAYTTLGLSESDTSPLYMVAVVARAFFFIPKARMGLLVTLLLSCTLITVNAIDESDPRIIKFAATMVMAEALFHVGRSLVWVKKYDTFKLASIIWITGGAITLLNPEALATLFFRLGTTEGRGATGFAPEPSYYGLASAFLFGIVLHIGSNLPQKKQKESFVTAIIFALSTIISGSLHALIILALLMIKRWPKLALIAIPSAAVSFLIIDSGNEIRLLSLISNAIETGGASILIDESIAYRLANFSVVANSFSGVSTGADTALASGLTILFVAQGAIGAMWAALFISAGSWRFALWRMTCDPVQLPIVIAMLFIGPLSCPFFWLYLGVGEYAPKSRKPSNHESYYSYTNSQG